MDLIISILGYYAVKKSSYFGSVRFFKHLYLTILALLIVVPSVIAVSKSVSLSKAQRELDELRQSAPAPESAVIEQNAETGDDSAAQKIAPEGERSAVEILDSQPLIAHGLGEVGGKNVLNCLEAFEENYAAGIRVFEVDLRMTSDGHVVLRHDWRAKMQEGVSETSIPTLEEFLAAPISGKYTPLSFRDLLYLMEQHPDICIITDTKFVNEEEVTRQFRAMLDDAYETGLTYLFGRMVIQIYTPLMFKVADHLYHFPYYIFTLYNSDFDGTEDSFRQQAVFCQENGIMGITMSDYWWTDNAPDYYPIASWRGIRIYVHTVNDADRANSLLASGVSGIYTDTLLPDDIDR